MSERYTKLFSSPANLYAAGAPVVVAAGALLKDNQTGNVLVQLKLQNIDRRQIKAAAVAIFPMDTAGDALAETTTYQYLDLRAGRDAFFGQKTAIQLPNAATRSFSVAVTEIVFADNGKWTATENVWEPLPVPTPVDRWGDLELATQFQIDYGAGSENLPLEEKDIWFCVCGAINHKGETNCHSCGQLLSRLREIDLDELRKEKDERLQRERADAERRRKPLPGIGVIG